MANTLAREGKRAAHAAVIRNRQVAAKTTLLLFRCRNVIEEPKTSHQVVADEFVLWGWRGTPQQKEFISHEQAKALLSSAQATSDLSALARSNFLENELKLLQSLRAKFDTVAEQQSQKLVAAHERFSALMVLADSKSSTRALARPSWKRFGNRSSQQMDCRSCGAVR